MTASNTEIPRDRYGRPTVMPPSGRGKRIPYQRTTTFVGALENTYNLMAWKQRQTVLGMAARKDLILAAAAAEPDDKRLLDDIAEKACEHALAGAAATTGTALHSLTERVDRGKPLGDIPDAYLGDIHAYQEATAGIEYTGIETFRVHDDWKVAGTADRIGRYNGRLMIMDIKTGSIDYPHKMAMQLAMYARSLPYDIPTDKRQPPDNVDLNTGIIIHLPAGQGECNLYEIDIAKGWGACLIAKQVWAWRATKGLTHRVGDDRDNTWTRSNGTSSVTDLVRLDAAALIELMDEITSINELRQLWSHARDTACLTDDFRAAAETRSKELRTTQERETDNDKHTMGRRISTAGSLRVLGIEDGAARNWPRDRIQPDRR